MNRREAIAALVALPASTRISAVPAASDDVIVLEISERLSDDACKRLGQMMQAVWPGRKCVVLENGAKLKLVPR